MLRLINVVLIGAHFLFLPVSMLPLAWGGPAAIAQTQTAETVAKIAQAITVRIEGATQGSGVIVKREGSRYTVLTSWHVVSGQRPGEDLDIYTFDGQRHRLEQGSIKRLGEVDLAILSFASSSSYEIAQVGDAKSISSGSKVYVSGFPLETSAVPARIFRFLSGDMIANADTAIPNGYQMLYSNPTLPGMSGGPLMDSRGQLVGVHGQGETDSRMSEVEGVAVKTGVNQAVPISYYLRYFVAHPLVGATTPSVADDEYLTQSESRPLSAAQSAENLSPTAAEVEAERKVLISELVVRGIESSTGRKQLENAVYKAMVTRPGSRVVRKELENDLSAIYATGWFSDVRFQLLDSSRGARLVLTAVPNPVLTQVKLDGVSSKIKMPANLIPKIFSAYYGKIINLNVIQGRMVELQEWYSDQGYSLARISGPTRIGLDGVVQLDVREGTVAGVEIQYLDNDRKRSYDNEKPIKDDSRTSAITREISVKPGDPFNRYQLEKDIKRLYTTGLLSDVKIALRPANASVGEVVIVLAVAP